jgi:hypothetical protein
MDITDLILEIDHFLSDVESRTDEWFDKPEDLRKFRPADQGWTIDEILEHIVLTSHFLLKLIGKGVDKALRNVHQLDLTAELSNYTFHREGLDAIGMLKSFPWIRPAHMEPGGHKPLNDIRSEWHSQVKQCRDYLKKMSGGEGVLYKTTMSVNGLGKIDVYEYIYFLAKHAARHLEQMRLNEKEWKVNSEK